MRMAKALSHVTRIYGVAGYIFIDRQGNILAHSEGLQHSEKLSKMVYFCGRKIAAIGRKYFKYVSFSRKNDSDILIFPIGNYYLGVIKKKGIKNFTTASTVMDFLSTLVGKSDEKKNH